MRIAGADDIAAAMQVEHSAVRTGAGRHDPFRRSPGDRDRGHFRLGWGGEAFAHFRDARAHFGNGGILGFAALPERGFQRRQLLGTHADAASFIACPALP